MSQLEHLQTYFGHLRGIPLLKEMVRVQFKGRSAVLSSFGAESSLLLAMVAKVNRDLPVIFLNTGKHFEECLEYKNRLVKELKLTHVIEAGPDEKSLEEEDPLGDLWEKDPDSCCRLRKTWPLSYAVQKHKIKALITGRKRFQTPERQNLHSVEQDAQGIFKINPLAFFTEKEVKEHLDKVPLPEHPLIKKGYLSIGCAPCTSPFCQEGDPRAGRWPQSEEKTECGIHL